LKDRYVSALLVSLVALAIGQAGLCKGQESRFEQADWEKRINQRQPPQMIIDGAGLEPGMVVGEIGAGTGRVTLWMADRVGVKGRVYANDINQEYLDELAERGRKEGLDNIEVVLGEVNDPLLPEGKLDIVFVINVYHHAEDPVVLLHNAIPSLNQDGVLVVVECDPAKVDWGEEHGCLAKDEMVQQLGKAGYEKVRIDSRLDEDQIYIFRPAR
jgi:ubiquinone/menaquinone biosynthesis C-methylase UbiE